MKPNLSRRLLLEGAATGGLTAVVFGTSGVFRCAGAQILQPLNPKLTGDLYPIHDPCVIKGADTFYVFCTSPRADAPAQIPWFHSNDLLHWERGGHVFTGMPDWARKAVPRTHECWAPDISFFNGRYWLYYACSTFGSNRSVIGLASNATLNPAQSDYHWEDHGLVLESQTKDDFNAIDPNRLIDRSGKHWLAFGSFWTGLMIVEIDPQTGKPAPDATRTSIARRPKPPDAIEGVFIIQRASHYYLFASFDFCCRGADSSYYTVVGRSADPQGPYVDKSGKPMLEGGGTVVLAAGVGERRWRAPGHIAILRDEGKDYIFYHAYDADHDGRPTLRIAPLGWSDDNWPVVFV